MTKARQAKKTPRAMAASKDDDGLVPVTEDAASAAISARSKPRKTRAPASKAASAIDAVDGDDGLDEKPSQAAVQGKKTRVPKTRLVKLRFELHDSEARLLKVLKQSLSDTGFAVKKGELLRMAIGVLLLQSPEMLKSSQEALATSKVKQSRKAK